MTEHTPGPWQVKFDIYAGYDCMTSGYEITAGKQAITTVDTADYDGDDDHGESPQAAANARLIAAAPDLLAAAEAVLKYEASLAGSAARGEFNLMESGAGVAISETLDALFDDWMEKAHSAVAKARGEVSLS